MNRKGRLCGRDYRIFRVLWAFLRDVSSMGAGNLFFFGKRSDAFQFAEDAERSDGRVGQAKR
jgi:hypothetical protein